MIEAVKHYINIDVLAEKSSRVCYIRRADIGHEMHISVRAGGRPITLPTAAEGLVQFVYEKPDGTKSDCMTEVIGNEAVFMLPRAAVDAEGEVPCEIRVYVSAAAGTYYTTPKMMLVVQDVIYNAEAQQNIESDPTAYEQMVAKFAEWDTAEAAREENETERIAAENARKAAGYLTAADVDDEIDTDSENPVQNQVIAAALENKSDVGHTHDGRYYTKAEVDELIEGGGGDLSEYAKKEELSAAAFSGSYNDLDDKPTIPSVTQGTFTANYTEATGSRMSVRQIGDMVFMDGYLGIDGTWADIFGAMGTLAGVDAPSSARYLPCLTGDGTNWHTGYLGILNIKGTPTVGIVGVQTDSIIIVSGHYTV